MPSHPLFPLPVVLFPGALMPLHVFEPRYQALLSHCADGDHRFVIVPPGPDGDPLPGSIGTVARIRAIQILEDGRSNIVVSGEHRVNLGTVSPAERGGYLLGAVETLEDLPDVEVSSRADLEALTVMAERYAAALGTIADVDRETELAAEAGTLSFQVAALLEWDFGAKLRFLAIRSAHERVTRLLATLPRMLARLEERARVHKRASTNGKGPH